MLKKWMFFSGKIPQYLWKLVYAGESSQCIFCEEAVTAWNLTKKKKRSLGKTYKKSVI